MTINLTDPANQLTNEQVVKLQLRIMSALSFYRQRPEKEARRMAELLELAGAAASELQERRKSDAPPSPQPSKMSGIMPDYEGVAMTQRECYMAGKEAGLAEAALKHQSNNFTDEDLEGMIHGNNPVANAYRELLAFRRNSDGRIPDILPCKVLLVPGLHLGKGVKTQLLFDALKRRAEYYAELDAMTPEQRAEHDAGVAEFKAMLAGNSPVTTDCWCRTCRPVTMTDMRFVVCPECGNKRCPHANDHNNACTGSNEPGQIGSAYPAAPQEVK